MAYYSNKQLIRLFIVMISGSSLFAVAQKKDYAHLFSLPHAEHRTNACASWWCVTTEHDLSLYNERTKKWGTVREKSALIRADAHGLSINNTLVPSQKVIVRSDEGRIWVNGVPYTGLIFFERTDDGVHMTAHHPMVLNKAKVVGSALIDDYMCQVEEQNTAREQQHKEEQLEQLQEVRNQEHGSIPEKKALIIRVLLHQVEEKEVNWHFGSDAGFFVTVHGDREHKKKVVSPTLTITARNGKFIVNDRLVSAESLTITPREGHATCKGVAYQGSFIVQKENNKLLLMNALDLEDYVCSVLKTETWPGWPLEINKVCAIASRSYAIAIAMRSQKAKKPYHIKNTNEHQTYNGIHSCRVIKQAVEETQGMFLSYEEKPIVAMFDICCGGVIPAHIEDFDSSGDPYLAREYACKHCKRCRVYSWGTQCRLDEFSRRVNQRYKKMKHVKKIKMVKKDKAGLVQLVELQGTGGKLMLSGRELYSLMKEVKSLCFRVRQKGSTVIFDQARGHGHHIGLCQWGAREMVRDGWDYKKILQFYYPNTIFMKIA